MFGDVLNNKKDQANQLHGYVIEISESLHKKIENQIKRLNCSHSKKSWVLEAIKEKLQAPPKVAKQTHLNLLMSQELNLELEEQVTQHKQYRKSYSKKKWIVEALYEKLEREENQAEALLERFKSLLSSEKK